MSDRSRHRRRWIAVALAVPALVALVAGVYFLRHGGGRLPRPDSETYREMVSAFYAGVAALDVDANDRAQAALTRATRLVPEEPAAWADRGLLWIRLGDFEAAAQDLERARALAPESGAVERLLGLLEGRRGQFAAAIAHLRRAIELEPDDLKSRFALAQEVERQGGPDSEAEAQRLIEEILELRPDNLAVLLERARLAAKRGDDGALGETIARLGKRAGSWPPRAQEQYRALEQQAAQGNLRLAATRVAFLRNVLLPVPAFRQGLDAVETPPGRVGEPIGRFLRLPPPASTPAPPDDALAFAVEPLAAPDTAQWDGLLAVSLTGEGPPAVFLANGREVRRADAPGPVLPFPGGPAATPPSPHGVLALDLDSDYRMDFALAGAGGLRLSRQDQDGAWADVTAAAGLDPSLSGAAAFGAWAADVEMDGDVDIVLGPREGAPAVLRNNGDGTFGVLHPFEVVSGLRDFAWADLDGDGDPDAGLLDARGVLRVYANERSGQFHLRPVPEGLGRLVALAVADANSDAAIDLLALRADGTVLRISDEDEGRSWDVAEVVRWPGGVEVPVRLFVGDLDNNGGLDLVASAAGEGRVWLRDSTGGFRPVVTPVGLRIFAVADLSGDGRLDLASLTAEGRPLLAVGRGSKAYHWQVLRPRAARVFGDGRINSFGIGGEVQVRAGLLVQTQVIAGPTLHFGLGEHPAADVVRIVWPNGTAQAEFDTKADQAILAEQRLKGSCPFLFAFDGTAVRFVTDFLWRSPLGLRINAQATAGVMQTEDWVKIRGDQLAESQGHYDLRITAELWETHFFDHVALLVVDHSEGTEVFVDERFARRPPPLALHPTGAPHPVAYAWDDTGRDGTEFVRARDGRYLDTFGRGAYQGVTRDHWVEIELGEDTPRDRPLWLVAHGWIHPTDSSINVALGQGRHAPPQGLVLEVPTRAGSWVVAQPDLGFPAGKDKTILVDLEGVFRPGAPRRLRLRTNLEIYWDALAVAVAAADTPMLTRRIAPETAELRSRGYSLMTQADASSPERPRYDTIVGTGQRWRDLIGHYTRFGDVRDLLERVDDRYVIANAGDELALRFAAPPSPPAGWVRDFVLIGDGWNKDGDYNTAFSQTVLPLPSHDRPAYDTPPGALEDDPVYRLHRGDWQEYHTRFVTPRVFQEGLKPRGQDRP